MFLFQLLLTNWTIFAPHIHTRLFSYKWALPTEVVRLLPSFLVSQWRRIVNHAITTVSSTSVRYCAIWSISWVPSAVESFPRRLVPTVFQIELFQGRAPAHNIRMRMGELTSRELSSVRCPTCGVAAGERCRLHSGSPCFEPHLDRKLSAIESLEQKRVLEVNLRAASKYLRAKID
jgi:hypothetical protein